jgi:hypothetical protein
LRSNALSFKKEQSKKTQIKIRYLHFSPRKSALLENEKKQMSGYRGTGETMGNVHLKAMTLKKAYIFLKLDFSCE